MADETLLTLTTDIVSAHVSHNSVTADQLPVLIGAVYASLASLGQELAPVEEKREPAVSIRSSACSSFSKLTSNNWRVIVRSRTRRPRDGSAS